MIYFIKLLSLLQKLHEMPNYPYARISFVKGRSVILNDSPLKRGEFPIHPWNLNLLNNVEDTVVFLAWNLNLLNNVEDTVVFLAWNLNLLNNVEDTAVFLAWNLNLLNNVEDTVVFLAWNIFISNHYFFSIKTLFYAKVHKNS